MRKLTTEEVARMTTTQGESFNDQVTLYGYVQSQDSLGQFVDSFKEYYKSKSGETYNDTTKDYVIVATLIKRHGVDAVVKKSELLAKHCEDRDVFFTKDDGWRAFTIGNLSAHWNRLIEIAKEISGYSSKLWKLIQEKERGRCSQQ